ncbi:MAG: Acetyltransferase domain [Bacillota bacterium]|nr:Acetyltransferase domain [Bacillota bacterium]
MHGVEVREIAPADMDDINKMCVMPGSEPRAVLDVLRESAEAHRKAAAIGAKVFGAFLGGVEPVGRIEIMPIEAAPVPLEGEGLWVIRCLWVLDKARGLGIARSLMQLGLDAAQASKGVAVLTYPGWMPAAFFERFGFQVVGRKAGGATVLLRKTVPGAGTRVSLVSPIMPFARPENAAFSRDVVRVEAVFNSRCPWVMQRYRKYLSIAASISDRVVTHENVIHTHADALRLGEENLYIDGVAPFSGPVPPQELERVVKDRLAAKGLG